MEEENNKDVDYQVLVGNCMDTIKTLPDKSVNTCVTSPPYFGLRDYGVDGQFGLEPTPDEFVDVMVKLFREVRRVLRDDGTVWLNLGDSYAGSSKGRNADGSSNDSSKDNKQGTSRGTIEGILHKTNIQGLKSKDLIGIPWKVAFALQADGWYLRQDIIWHKPNPMPESVNDRCTKSHEYIFLLSKSQNYYYDMDSIKENSFTKPQDRKRNNGISVEDGKKSGVYRPNCGVSEKRNKRSVWTVTTKPYRGAHFAAFPPDLIKPCILAGCPEGGTVLDPFGGSGTTAGVAVVHNRNAILCELNPEYVELVPDRVKWIYDYYDVKPDQHKQINLMDFAI